MTTQQINSSLFKTSDLALTALLSLELPICDIDRTDPKRVEFYFEDNTKIHKLVKKYWTNQLKVEPKQFFQQLKVIKSRIYGTN